MSEKTISQAIQDFIDSSSVLKSKTGQTYKTPLNHFLSFLSEQDIKPDDTTLVLTVEQARSFARWVAGEYRTRADQELSIQSKRLYFIAITRFYRSLIVSRLIDATMHDYQELAIDLSVKINRTTIEEKLPTEKMVRDLLKLVEERPNLDDIENPRTRRRIKLAWLRNRAIIHCLYSGGIRVGELVALRRGDLNYEDLGVWVITQKQKGESRRFVKLSATTWKVLGEYLVARLDVGNKSTLPLFCRHDPLAGENWWPMSTRSVQRLFEKLTNQLGITEEFHLTPHSLRHYFATRYLQHTGDLALTQDALGHEDPGTTRIYAKTSKAQLIKAHDEIFD